MNRMSNTVCTLLLLLVLLCLPAMAQTEFDTTGALSAGTARVAVEGSYNGDAQAAIDRINAIRLEACREGVRDPRNTGRRLTENDYVPIRWSASLEYIARVRAAESSLVTSHVRPNGQMCFSVTAPDGTGSYGEVLAWNWSNTMVSGVEQWYREKQDWVNQTGAVTGHYTQMIDPDNRCVGLASFTNPEGIYLNTVSGEFSSNPARSASQAAPVADCRVYLAIAQNALGGASVQLKPVRVKGDSCLDKGDVVALSLVCQTSLQGCRAVVYDAGTVTWTSSNTAVASVSGDGTAVIRGTGTATICAVSSSGRSASTTLTAAHQYGAWKTIGKATVFTESSEKRTCSICGESEQRSVPKLKAKLTLSKSSLTVQKGKKATVKATFANGDSVKATSSNKSVATVSVKGGTITVTGGKKAGTATVTVTTASGLKKTLKVSVPKVHTTKVTCKNITVKKGKTAQLKYQVTPTLSDDKLTFSSSNKKVAVVSSKGVVKGVGKGTATITVRSGSKTVKVKVTVK